MEREIQKIKNSLYYQKTILLEESLNALSPITRRLKYSYEKVDTWGIGLMVLISSMSSLRTSTAPITSSLININLLQNALRGGTSRSAVTRTNNSIKDTLSKLQEEELIQMYDLGNQPIDSVEDNNMPFYVVQNKASLLEDVDKESQDSMHMVRVKDNDEEMGSSTSNQSMISLTSYDSMNSLSVNKILSSENSPRQKIQLLATYYAIVSHIYGFQFKHNRKTNQIDVRDYNRAGQYISYQRLENLSRLSHNTLIDKVDELVELEAVARIHISGQRGASIMYSRFEDAKLLTRIAIDEVMSNKSLEITKIGNEIVT